MKYFILFSLIFYSSQLFGQHDFYQYQVDRKSRLFSKMMLMKPMSDNQKQFDVHYYKLQIEALPDSSRIKGLVETRAKVVAGPIDFAEINLVDNLEVDSILIGGEATSFEFANDILVINLDKTYLTDELFSITIYYQGTPQLVDDFRGFDFSTHNNKPIFWTSSEPFEARTWWPCKDYPEDKADSVDIIVTVPDGMIVASNGLLFDTINSDGKTTYYWKERYPIATYLVSLAAYAYKCYSDQYTTLSGDTMSIDFFVFPEHYNNSEFRSNYALTKTMIKAFASYFGEYPFVNEKYGHAEWGIPGAAMEHQTCTSLGLYDPIVIAHELAHQWWGDMITCRDFQHIWLNEGFATYSEALWREYSEGKAAYYEEISGDAYIGGGTIYVENATGFWNIFDSDLTYRKPSYVLHMLRHVVGDSVFFKILKAYHADLQLKFDTAVTEDFKRVSEQISGLQLDKFFEQWIYGEYGPSYNYSWNYKPLDTKYELQLEIRQTQTYTGLFWMPLDIKISTDFGDTTIVVWDSLETQYFTFHIDDEPKSVKLDPDNWVLASSIKDVTDLPDEPPAVLDKFDLFQNYPNPFNPTTTISYQLPVPSSVELSIYNILGERVATLVSGKQKAGKYKVQWEASGFASGVYYGRLQAERGLTKNIKLVLLK